MWFDKSSYLQYLTIDLAQEFINNGWKNFLKFRAVNATKYADVRLFKSLGSDDQNRYLGMAWGYDTSKTSFNDERVIFADSPLGYVATGDGSTVEFHLKLFPVQPGDIFDLYVDGNRVEISDYTLDREVGTITFNTAPVSKAIITAGYKLGPQAPEPPTKLVFFTFNGVLLEKQNESTTDNTGAVKLGDGDGITKIFHSPTAPIKPGTLKVYVDSMMKYENTDYTVNYDTGAITFNVAPTLGKEITITYTALVSGEVTVGLGTADGSTKVFNCPTFPIVSGSLKVYLNGAPVASSAYTADYTTGVITFTTAPVSGQLTATYSLTAGGGAAPDVTIDLGDMNCDAFDPTIPEDIAKVIYSSITFLYPSIPTVISFTTQEKFGRAWQRDSFMYYWGNINRDRINIFMRPDPTGGPETALFAPLYAGRLLCKGKVPRRNMALIGGCRVADEIKWATDKFIGATCVDYGPTTSNGNSSPMLSQSIGGSYYQKHYFAFITHDMSVDSGDGKYNPSLYSGKYHLSPIYLVHPNDGFVGKLDDCYAVHPKNIMQMDELEIDETVTDEEVGTGDGFRRIFHVDHNPIDGTLVVKVDCVATTDFSFDPDTKAIRFNTIPTAGKAVTASYRFKQVYRFTVADTPVTPYQTDEVTPFKPIGLAILKENKPA